MKVQEDQRANQSPLLLELAQKVVIEAGDIALDAGLKREDAEKILRLAVMAEELSTPSPFFGGGAD